MTIKDGVLGIGIRDGKPVLHVMFKGEHRYMTVSPERAEDEVRKGVPQYFQTRGSYKL